MNARSTDPESSHDGADANPTGKMSDRAEVEHYHRQHAEAGLTDDEVAVLAGRGLWKRCSDLRRDKKIEWMRGDDGLVVRRPSRSGISVRVSRIVQ